METIVMTGRKGTSADWTIGDIGAAPGAGAWGWEDRTSAKARVGELGRSNANADSDSHSG